MSSDRAQAQPILGHTSSSRLGHMMSAPCCAYKVAIPVCARRIGLRSAGKSALVYFWATNCFAGPPSHGDGRRECFLFFVPSVGNACLRASIVSPRPRATLQRRYSDLYRKSSEWRRSGAVFPRLSVDKAKNTRAGCSGIAQSESRPYALA